MTCLIEQVARALATTENADGTDLAWSAFIPDARAAIAAMREPTEAMVRAAIMQTDHTEEQLDRAAGVIEGMPPLAPHRQRDGILAAADMWRDWQSMIDAALAT